MGSGVVFFLLEQVGSSQYLKSVAHHYSYHLSDDDAQNEFARQAVRLWRAGETWVRSLRVPQAERARFDTN